jgi:hypothetical protein
MLPNLSKVTSKFNLVLEADNHVRVYENTNCWPEAFVATKVAKAATNAQMLRQLSEGLPRQSALLEADAPDELLKLAPTYTNARVFRINPNETMVQVTSSAPGLLILSDQFYPGWKATVNGQRTSILRANYLFRAVRVPKGRSVVRFSYEPLSFKIGVALFAVSAILIGILIIFGNRISRFWPAYAKLQIRQE